jgi:hypothetical protein
MASAVSTYGSQGDGSSRFSKATGQLMRGSLTQEG